MEQSSGDEVKTARCRYCGTECQIINIDYERKIRCGVGSTHYMAFFVNGTLDRDYFYNGKAVISRYHKHGKTWVSFHYKGTCIDRVLSDEESLTRIQKLAPWNLFL